MAAPWWDDYSPLGGSKQEEHNKGDPKVSGEHKAGQHNGEIKDKIHADYDPANKSVEKQHEQGREPQNGNEHGFEKGYEHGYQHGYEDGYKSGYEHGHDDRAHVSERGHDSSSDSEYGDHGSEYGHDNSNDSEYGYDDGYAYGFEYENDGWSDSD